MNVSATGLVSAESLECELRGVRAAASLDAGRALLLLAHPWIRCHRPALRRNRRPRGRFHRTFEVDFTMVFGC